MTTCSPFQILIINHGRTWRGNTIFKREKEAGAEAAKIIADVVQATSNVPKGEPFLKVEPPPGKFGTTDFGQEMHLKIGTALEEKYPDVPLILRVRPGLTGVDVSVMYSEDEQMLGFKDAEIKPDSASGQKTLRSQVQRWKNNGKLPQDASVQPLTYDADGNVNLGFKKNQSSK
jgi:hypothetical protein